MVTTWAKVQTRFEALHRWDDAFDEVKFLTNPHRHEFHLTVMVEQNHDDRDVEYIFLKRRLEDWLDDYIPEDKDLDQMSCEMIAKDILKQLQHWYSEDRDYRIEVTEDGENGALIET